MNRSARLLAALCALSAAVLLAQRTKNFPSMGRLVACEHGDRRISRLEKNGGKRTLVDSYMGKRLNSPNDAVYKSNGDLYFTDPPYGLPKQADDPRREMD